MYAQTDPQNELIRVDPDAASWRLLELQQQLPEAMLDALSADAGPAREAARRTLDALRCEIDRLQACLDARP
jgi:hypothetical protein